MYHTISIQALSKSQISKLLNGHRVIVKLGQGIEIHASEEQYKKIIKAHKKGSGVTIQFDPYQMENHQFLRGQGGEGMISNIMKSKLTKGIAKAVAPQLGNIVGQQVKNLTGSDVASNITKSLINEGSKEAFGNGFLSNVMKSKLTKGIAKAVAPQLGNIVGQQVKNLTGSDMAGNLTSSLIKQGSQEAFGNGLIGNIMKSKLTKGMAKAVAPQIGSIVGQQVKNLTGSDMAGNLTSSLIKQGSQEAFGGALLPAGYGIYKLPHPRKAGRPKKNN